MKVLHIIDSFNMGGAETWLLEIVKFTHKKENDFPPFDFLLAGGEPAIFDEEIKGYGCKLYYLKLDKNHTLSFIKGFRKILASNNYIAIHDHQDYLAGWHYLFGIGRLPKIRMVHFHNPFYQVRNNYGITANRRMKLRIGRFLLQSFATHIFGTSSKLLQEYNITAELFSKQVVAAVNCAFKISNFSGEHITHKKALCKEMGWSEEIPIVLFAGRFDKSLQIGHPQNHKNSAFALEVLNATEGINMVMAGINDFISLEFMQRVMDMGLGDRVKLLGVRKDMAHLMLAADALLFPSRAEGMGMVAVEAQAAGLPVLAADVVPNEIVVLPTMVVFHSLNESFNSWAEHLRKMIKRRCKRDTVLDPLWQLSPFNLEVCCDHLNSYYRGNAPKKSI